MGYVGSAAEAAQPQALDQSLLALLAVGFPLLLGRRVGAHDARGDVVDGDAERAELVGELARQPDLRRLRRGIDLDAGEADPESSAARDVDDAAGALLLHGWRD